MQKHEVDWEKVAAEQSEVIAGLSNLCAACIKELAQYRAIEREEEQYNELTDKES